MLAAKSFSERSLHDMLAPLHPRWRNRTAGYGSRTWSRTERYNSSAAKQLTSSTPACMGQLKGIGGLLDM